jgi:hypothetical protein
MKLTPSQSAVLAAANRQMFMPYSVACRAGGNGRTLAALCKMGLLEKIEYPDGSNDWQITIAGKRLALGAPA